MFISKEFEQFLTSPGVVHTRSSNYHPQSNGTIERLYSTLKSRLKHLCVDNDTSISLLLHKVLYDIRSTPHSVTGEAPFQRFFNIPMRTKLTVLAENPLASISPTRSVQKDYTNIYKGCTVQYCRGDLVLVRQGKGNPLHLPATVLKYLGNPSYLLRMDNDPVRKYIQCDLKRRFSSYSSTPDEIAVDELEAYDKISAELSTSATPRYNLRPNRPDLCIYKD